MKRSISRLALAAALSLGAVTAASAPAMAQQVKLSKGFQDDAVAISTALSEAKDNAAVTAASERAVAARNEILQARGDEAALAAANAKLEAARSEIRSALGGADATLQNALAKVETADDRQFAGQLTLQMGQLLSDPAMQKRGIDLMIASGKLPPEELPRYQYFSGALAMEAGDYAGARESMTKAMAGGFSDENVDIKLAEAYFAENLNAEGLDVLAKAIDDRRAAGQPVSEEMVFRGLGVAANNQLNDKAFDWALKVIEIAPRQEYREQAYAVLRAVGPFQPEEELDLLRLMHRADALTQRNDYLAYLELADARRRPAEVQSVIETGIAKGVLSASDTIVSEAQATVQARMEPIRAELAADATAARNAASGAEALAIADTYLGYGEAATAAELYQVAIDKGGIDQQQALTGLGIALADQGKYAEAKQTFSQLTSGNRTALARAWIAYVDTKLANPGAAAA